MNQEAPPLKYLLECSEISLRSFTYAQRTREAEARKHIKADLDEWVLSAALVLLGQWFEKYGAELVALAGAPAPSQELRSTAPLQEIPDNRKAGNAHPQTVFRPPHRVFRKAQKAG